MIEVAEERKSVVTHLGASINDSKDNVYFVYWFIFVWILVNICKKNFVYILPS